MKFKYYKILIGLPLIFILVLLNWSCQRDIQEFEKYQPGEWLEGKIFSQIETLENLDIFITCLRNTGYDTILNKSGSYTVFAPTDDAFMDFFNNHPIYNSIEDIPEDELVDLVEYQIITDAWSLDQFRILDVNGWIDPTDKLSKPRAYKHRTIHRRENMLYPVDRIGSEFKIVEESGADLSITAFTRSNKFSPVFFDEFFKVNNLLYSDFEFYFDRPFDPNNTYFSAAAFNTEIPAENGFIFKTDRVILPLQNGEELLQNEDRNHSYQEFLKLIYEFPDFNVNLDETFNQVGADEGLDLDTLYNLNYPELVFNISDELTGNANNVRSTHRIHHGLLAPTDEALELFKNKYIIDGWGSFDDIPARIKKRIVNSHMSYNAVYLSDIEKGFVNGNMDSIRVDMGNIVQKSYGSNCTFLGLNEAIVPRAFKSIARPIYLSREFQIMLSAVEETKILNAMKRPGKEYTFYLPRDAGIGISGDSSLVERENPFTERIYFETFDRSQGSWEKLGLNNLGKIILNQIGISRPYGIANKEFLRNLGGNYIVLDNVEGSVRGTTPTTFGFNGDSIITIEPQLYTEETDNGDVFIVDNFFNFGSAVSYYGMFLSEHIKFFNLLDKAGLYDQVYYNYPFLVEGGYYTVFIPSDEALESYGADTLSKKDLAEFLKYHFVKGEIIFTDGKEPAGLYETTLKDESSTAYVTKYSTLNINPSPDVINILDKNGNVYLEIPEEEGKTNKMIFHDTNKESQSNWDNITTGVVHVIDKVLIRDSLQAR